MAAYGQYWPNQPQRQLDTTFSSKYWCIFGLCKRCIKKYKLLQKVLFILFFNPFLSSYHGYIFDLDYNKKYCSGLLFVRQLSTRINTSAVYDNQLWMYENGFYYTSTRYGRIGIVQSERMINAHMICTQKQMKDIRGMRV